MARRRDQSETWSGTSAQKVRLPLLIWDGGGGRPGAPTEPKRMASYFLSDSRPPSGMYFPCFL